MVKVFQDPDRAPTVPTIGLFVPYTTICAIQIPHLQMIHEVAFRQAYQDPCNPIGC